MLASLPGSFGGRMHGVDFSGRADLAVRLTRAAAGVCTGWSGSMKLDRGRIAYSALPDALTDVAFVGHADTDTLWWLSGSLVSAVRRAWASHLNRAGWSKNAPLALSAKVVGLTIDERFRAGLPDSYARSGIGFGRRESWTPRFA